MNIRQLVFFGSLEVKKHVTMIFLLTTLGALCA